MTIMTDIIKSQLLQLAAEGNKEFAQKLNPGVEGVLGIRVPQLRSLAKEITRGDWRDYLAVADTHYMEERMLTGLVIACARDVTMEERFSLIRQWVPQINSWAVCDTVCATFKPKEGERGAWWSFIEEYLRGNEEYAIRFGVVMSLTLFVDAKHLTALFAHYSAIRHEAYYVRMAVAWAISVCYVKFPNETYDYLTQGTLDTFTHNKAIQKIGESYRVSKENKQRAIAIAGRNRP